MGSIRRLLLFTRVSSKILTSHATLTNSPQLRIRLQVLLPAIASSYSSLHSLRSDHCGGLRKSSLNSAEIDSLARFAVQEHNKKENTMLKLTRVVDMYDRLVAGTMHNLTLEIDDAGNKEIYRAKVWVKPWMDSKELHEFTLVEKRVIDASGYQSVPVHDPMVQDAADYVLKEVHPEYPYESQEVVDAKAEIVDGCAKYHILMKLKRDDKEAKFKADVHKDNKGVFILNRFVQDYS